MWAKDDIFAKYHCKIPSKFFWVSFGTEKLNRNHREVFAPLSFVVDKGAFILSSFSFSLFIDFHDWTGTKHSCKAFNAAAEFPDEKETYRWLSSA